jgi:hypothetical protein
MSSHIILGHVSQNQMLDIFVLIFFIIRRIFQAGEVWMCLDAGG